MMAMAVNQSTSNFFSASPASQSPRAPRNLSSPAPTLPVDPEAGTALHSLEGLKSKFKMSRSIKSITPQSQVGGANDDDRSPFLSGVSIIVSGDAAKNKNTNSNSMLPPPPRISKSRSKEMNTIVINNPESSMMMSRTIHNPTTDFNKIKEIETFKKPIGRANSNSNSRTLKQKDRIHPIDGGGELGFNQLERAIDYEELSDSAPHAIDDNDDAHLREFRASQFEDPLTQLTRELELARTLSQQRRDELDEDLNALHQDTERIGGDSRRGGRGEKRGRDHCDDEHENENRDDDPAELLTDHAAGIDKVRAQGKRRRLQVS